MITITIQDMQNYLIKNISIVNEGRKFTSDLLIRNGRIEKIADSISVSYPVTEINGENLHLLPGSIDDQVHFREPGLTHKGTIYTEAKAAVAGGTTSFMEMPNTIPPVFTQELLQNKYQLAANSSLANYSFYMGTSNDNADEALRTNNKRNEVCERSHEMRDVETVVKQFIRSESHVKLRGNSRNHAQHQGL